MQFKKFFVGSIINEENDYFGAKIGDVLNAVQDLDSDSATMGPRHLTRVVQNIVNRIRAILKGPWSIRQRQSLEDLQRIGVALAKAIDEKGDLQQVLKSVSEELEEITSKLGVPVNQLGTDIESEDETV